MGKSNIFFIAILILGPVQIFSMDEKDKDEEKKYLVSEPVSYSKGESFKKFLKWSNEKEKTVEALKPLFKDKKECLLDIGAGNGLLTKLLEKNFKHIVAVEPSKKMFKELTGNLNPQKTTFINKKFQDTNIKKKFNVILASHVFQYIDNPLEVIKQINNNLKKDGIFLLVNNRESEFTKFYNKYKADILGEKNTSLPVAINYDLSELLEKVFDVETKSFSSTLSVPSVDDILSIFDFIYDIEFEEMQEGSLERTKKDMEKTYDGPVVIGWKYNLYVCRKQ